MDAIQLLTDQQLATVLSHPTRRAVLQHLIRQQESSAGLARALGEPRQRINHHVRALEEAGLILCVEEHRRGNCTERIMGPAASRLVGEPTLLGLDASAERACRAGWGACRAVLAEGEGRVMEIGLPSLDAVDRRAFWEDLERAVAGVAREYAAGEGVGPGSERLILALSQD